MPQSGSLALVRLGMSWHVLVWRSMQIRASIACTSATQDLLTGWWPGYLTSRRKERKRASGTGRGSGRLACGAACG